MPTPVGKVVVISRIVPGPERCADVVKPFHGIYRTASPWWTVTVTADTRSCVPSCVGFRVGTIKGARAGIDQGSTGESVRRLRFMLAGAYDGRLKR